MIQDPFTPHRFEALDALRGICALLVVLFHIPIYHALKDVPAFANLQLCVDIFFVLSGFVLYHAYGQRLTGRADGVRFLTRRFLRLWPLHVLMLALLILLDVAKLVYGHANPSFSMDAQPFSEGHSSGEIATNLAFLQSFGLHSGLSWNGPAWSAAVEFYVAIVFTGIMLAFPQRHLAVFLAFSLAAAVTLHAVSPDTFYVSTDWGILRAIAGFFAGCLVCAMRKLAKGRLKLATLFEVTSVATLLACAAIAPAGNWYALFLPLICGLIYVFSFDCGDVSALLRKRWLQALGLWSYSIYMIHTIVFAVVKTAMTFVGRKMGLDLVVWHNDEKLMVFGSPGQALVPALVLSIVLVVPLAALTYHWIERPTMTPESWRKWRLRMRSRSTAAQLPGAPA